MISDVPSTQLPLVWNEVGPMLERALKHGQGDGMRVEAVLQELIDGTRSLWLIHDTHEDGAIDVQAAVVTSLHLVPGRGKKLLVDLLAGEGMGEWIQDLQAVLDQAVEVSGAFCMEASCRPGLAKYLKQNMGWKTKAVVMELSK